MKSLVFSQLITACGGIAVGVVAMLYLSSVGQIDLPRPQSSVHFKTIQDQLSTFACLAPTKEVTGPDGDLVGCK